MSDRTAPSTSTLDVTYLPVIRSTGPLLNEALNHVHTDVWVAIASEVCPTCRGELEAIWEPWFVYTNPQNNQKMTEHVLVVKCQPCKWIARTDDRLPQNHAR